MEGIGPIILAWDHLLARLVDVAPLAILTDSRIPLAKEAELVILLDCFNELRG